MEHAFNSSWDIFNFVLSEFEHIRVYRDDYSREIGLLIQVIGASFLRHLAFVNVRKFVSFLRRVEIMQDEVFNEFKQLDRKRVFTGLPRIRVVLVRLKSQLDLLCEDSDGRTSSRQVPAGEKIQVRVQLLEQVNVLSEGHSFG